MSIDEYQHASLQGSKSKSTLALVVFLSLPFVEEGAPSRWYTAILICQVPRRFMKRKRVVVPKVVVFAVVLFIVA